MKACFLTVFVTLLVCFSSFAQNGVKPLPQYREKGVSVLDRDIVFPDTESFGFSVFHSGLTNRFLAGYQPRFSLSSLYGIRARVEGHWFYVDADILVTLEDLAGISPEFGLRIPVGKDFRFALGVSPDLISGIDYNGEPDYGFQFSGVSSFDARFGSAMWRVEAWWSIASSNFKSINVMDDGARHYGHGANVVFQYVVWDIFSPSVTGRYWKSGDEFGHAFIFSVGLSPSWCPVTLDLAAEFGTNGVEGKVGVAILLEKQHVPIVRHVRY